MPNKTLVILAAGMNLVFAIVINSFIDMTIRKKWMRRFLFVIYNGLIAYNLFLYRGRTSQFAFAVFLIFFIFLNNGFLKHFRLITGLVIGIITGGFIFPILYIGMPKTIVNWIADTTGKPYFSGREIIWSRFFLSLTELKNLLIGPGSWRKGEFTTLWAERRVYTMHNNYLDILLCFGLLGAIVFLLFTAWRIYNLCKNGKINNYVCLCGYFCFLILGYSENTFTYAFFAVLTNLLLGLSIYDDNESLIMN